MSNTKNKISVVTFFIFILLVTLFIGCKNDNGISPLPELNKHQPNNVSVSFYSGTDRDNNTLNLTQVKFVLRQMCLKISDGGTTSDIRMEPFVVTIESPPSITTVAIATIPSTNYHLLKLQIHKPNSHEISDPDFTESNRNFSVVVKGFFNGEPFIFKSAITAARGIIIENSPIFISPTVLVNFTITLNPYLWFDHNGEMMDPMNENNRNEIDKNIKDSFNRVFRDLDMNGHPD